MTFNSGNLWLVKCWICWTQCETQESWVRQLHPYSVMYFFMTSVQHFLLPWRACFSELFRRINGHKHVLTRKHLKFEWYRNTSQLVHGINLPRIPVLSDHSKLSTWSVSMFRLLAVSHFHANVPLRSSYLWFSQSLFACFHILLI